MEVITTQGTRKSLKLQAAISGWLFFLMFIGYSSLTSKGEDVAVSGWVAAALFAWWLITRIRIWWHHA